MAAEFYADSSFLVSLFRRDAHHSSAQAFMARRTRAVAFSPLNRIELRNALRNAEAAGEVSREDRRAAFRRLQHDLDEGLLVHLAIDWTRTFRRADELSEEHAARQGQRTIDLLHVAIALESGAKTFLSFDERQRKLAVAAGLEVKP